MFQWVPFLLYMVVMSFTPGPNNIMAMNNARNAGFRKGTGFCVGGLAGGVVVMTLSVLFSAFLYAFIPKIQFPMKLFAAAYMGYLIVLILLPSRVKQFETKKGNFFMGFLMTIINPKIILFGITVMSSYITPYYKEPLPLALFILLLSAIGFSSMICWSLFGSLFGKMFNRHGKMVNGIMTIMLLYCIITLFL
jgi:threonine/homoserine/homoserine lactone efflux protein